MTVEIRKQPLLGTRAFLHSIVLDDVVIHEQVGPYSEAEIESRIASHLRNDPVSPRTDAKRSELVAKGSIGGQMKRGGRPSKATVNERGFLWREETEDER